VDGQGPPLVMVHGWSWSIADFYEYGWVKDLQDSYQLILIDPRGHGYSDKPHEVAAYALNLMAQDVLAVMDTLAISKACYLGVSMGGRIGFALLRYAPERIQAFLVGAASPYAWDPEKNDFLYDKLRGGMRAYYDWDIPDSPNLTVTDWFMCRRLANDPAALISCMRAHGTGFEDVLPNNTVPCLFFAGSLDGILPDMQRCVAEMPNAQLLVIPNRAHGELFRFTEPLPRIKKFLAEVYR
jgi:pimeloyl-ACP methyl ester carboxylesterase